LDNQYTRPLDPQARLLDMALTNLRALLLLRRLGRLFKVFSGWGIFTANLVHLFARTRFNTFLLGVNISVESGFTHFFAAARLVAYAIATACLTGLPAFTSVFTFSLNALGEADFLSILTNLKNKPKKRLGTMHPSKIQTL
jgi:hypothetical protein